jgi:putative heme-binding domain-containing protein
LHRPPADEHLRDNAIALLCFWKNEAAIAHVRRIAADATMKTSVRSEAALAWITSRDPEIVDALPFLLTMKGPTSIIYRRELFDGLTLLDDEKIAQQVLSIYPELEVELRPAAVELLTSRVAWSNALIDAIAAGQLPKDAVNVTQIAKLLKSGDKQLAARVEQTWGKLRTDRNPLREQVVADMKKLLVGSAGDPLKGQIVYMKLCGQCHKLHGTGQDVGPDITVNGRASFEQLVNNVFDPSLVIGNAYQARTIVTSDGRVLTGLLVEDNPQRVVLKLQGGKHETIARGDVEEMEVSKLSLMPEGVEKQLTPQELIDLFALLKLDKSPTDPNAKPLPNFSELK